MRKHSSFVLSVQSIRKRMLQRSCYVLENAGEYKILQDVGIDTSEVCVGGQNASYQEALAKQGINRGLLSEIVNNCSRCLTRPTLYNYVVI